MSLHSACVPTMANHLNNLLRWLDKAEEYAKAREFDPEVLLAARLAPDMYPLTRQIQAACDAAKFAATRLGRKEAPTQPDEESTLAELRERIHATVEIVEAVTPDDFRGVEELDLELSFLKGKLVRGPDYLFEMALPNFLFHVTTAYAILRHNGVPLGKRDFITSLTFRDA